MIKLLIYPDCAKISLYIKTCKVKSVSLFIIILIVLIGCTDNYFTGVKEYYGYTDKKKNGLVSKKETNGFCIQVKYLAPALCALEEMEAGITNQPIDTLIQQNQYCRSFLITITEKAGNQAGNILKYNIESKEQYKQRLHEVDFHMGRHFYLKSGEEQLYPQLYTTDKPFGSNGKLSVRLKFVAETKCSPLLKNQDLILVFNDPLFDTGTSTFKFTKENIQAIPQFKKS